MSAERLREAAALIRTETPSGGDDFREFVRAVADWLDATSHIESWGRHIGVGPVASTVDAAQAVADAYFGGAA